MIATFEHGHCHRLKELEAAAEQLQAALLAELDGPSQTGGTSSKKKSKARNGKKKQVCTLQAAIDTARLLCCFAVSLVAFACLEHYGMVTPVLTCLLLSFSDPILFPYTNMRKCISPNNTREQKRFLDIQGNTKCTSPAAATFAIDPKVVTNGWLWSHALQRV